MLVRFSHLLWTCWGGKLNDFLWKCANASNSFQPPKSFSFLHQLCDFKSNWMELSYGPRHIYYFIISKHFQSIWNDTCEGKKGSVVLNISASSYLTFWSRCPKKNSTVYLWISCIQQKRTVLNHYICPFLVCFLKWI